jgi:hypothetical protein
LFGLERRYRRGENWVMDRRFHNTEFGLLAGVVEAKRLAAELDALACIAADPATLFPVFYAAGGRRELFAPDSDAFLLYVAIAHAADAGRDRVLAARGAKLLLTDAGMWDATAAAHTRGPRWTDESPYALFDSYPISVTATRHRAGVLIALYQRQRDAAEHLEYARRILAGEAA